MPKMHLHLVAFPSSLYFFRSFRHKCKNSLNMWKKIRYIPVYVFALCSTDWTLLLSYIFCISVNKCAADSRWTEPVWPPAFDVLICGRGKDEGRARGGCRPPPGSRRTGLGHAEGAASCSHCVRLLLLRLVMAPQADVIITGPGLPQTGKSKNTLTDMGS